MSWLTSVSPTYHTIDRPPIHHVAVSGVWCCWWICARPRGNAFERAMDRAVREVGRIVVWVDAAADESTAMITILPSRLEPNTEFARIPSTSPVSSLARSAGPAYAIAAVDTIT